MKFFPALKYRLNETQKAIMTLYIAITCSYLLFYILARLAGQTNMSMNSQDTTSFIFVFVMGLNAFKPQLRLFLQNGISRPTLQLSFMGVALIMSVFMAIIDSLFPLVLNMLFPCETLYMQFYGGSRIMGVFWMAMVYYALASLGYLITVLYYHMNKWVKIIVSVGVPMLGFVGLPVFMVLYAGDGLLIWIAKVLKFVLGLDAFARPIYPMQSALCFLGIALCLLGIAYLFVRRAKVKES